MEDHSLHEKFREISKQRLVRLRSGVSSSGPEDEDSAEIMREIHTLKGEARILGFQAIATLAQKTEELLKFAGEGSGELVSRARGEILLGLDAIESSLREDSGSSNEMAVLDFTFRVDALLAGEALLEDTPPLLASADALGGGLAIAPSGTSRALPLAVFLAEILTEAEDFGSALGSRIELALHCDSIRLPPGIVDAWQLPLHRIFRCLVAMHRRASGLEASGPRSSDLCWTVRARRLSTENVRVEISGHSRDIPEPEEADKIRIQKEIALLGGDWSLRREEDEHSVFVFNLSTHRFQVVSNKADGKETRAKVMVIDDSSVTRHLLGDVLREQGYEVSEASHGGEALLLIDRELPDLFLVDLEMPVMDGFQLLEHLQEGPATQELPVIVFSSRNSKEDKQRCYDLGANAYLVKSEYRENEMVSEIASQLKGERRSSVRRRSR